MSLFKTFEEKPHFYEASMVDDGFDPFEESLGFFNNIEDAIKSAKEAHDDSLPLVSFVNKWALDGNEYKIVNILVRRSGEKEYTEKEVSE